MQIVTGKMSCRMVASNVICKIVALGNNVNTYLVKGFYTTNNTFNVRNFDSKYILIKVFPI